MNQKVMYAALLVLMLTALTACPTGQAQIAPGVWVLEYSLSGATLGLAIFADGSVMQPVPLPPEADTSFAGFMEWEQNGSQFILSWTSVETILFIAQVNTNDALSGTWVEVDTGDTGSWSARRVG